MSLANNIEYSTQLKQIWVSCWEEKHNDTKIEYPWGRGMPARQYPFNNDMPYVNPLLAIKVTPPGEYGICIYNN